MSQVNFIHDLYYWKNTCIWKEGFIWKKNQQLKTVIVSEENNNIEDLFENEALTWQKLSACAGGVTDFPL